MKRIKFLFVLAAVMFMMTGCMRYNASMEIKNDKSMDFKIIYAMDLSSFNSLGDLSDGSSSTTTEVMKPEEKAEFEKHGYKVNEYKDGNYDGYELVYSVKNIDDVSKNEDFELNLSDMASDKEDKNHFFTVKKGFLKNTYKAVYKFDANGSSSDSSSDTSFDITPYLTNMDLKFDVKLPTAAKSNNATKAEDGNKSLSWDLTQKSLSEISFEFDMYNITNICVLAGGVLFAIVLVVLIVVLSTRKKKA